MPPEPSTIIKVEPLKSDGNPDGNPDRFRYRKLESPNHIRLIKVHRVISEDENVTNEAPKSERLELELIHADITSKPAYAAVSYSWGAPSDLYEVRVRGTGTIRLSERVLDILERFLPVSAGEETSFLWLDQISINQDDQPEKGDQIKIMRQIYSDATHVFLMLDRADHDTDHMMKYVGGLNLTPKRRMRQNWKRKNEEKSFVVEPWTPDGISQTIVTIFCQTSLQETFTKLVTDRVFQRVWIYQEVVAARQLFLVGRHKSLSWDVFAAALDMLAWVKSQNADVGLIPPDSLQLMIDDRIANLAGAPTDWRLLHVRAQGLFGASDIRDHTIALTTFQAFYAQIRPTREIDLPVAEWYTTASRAMIMTGQSLDIWSAIRGPWHSPIREAEEMPSWVPDWSQPRLCIPLIWPRTATSFNAAKGLIHQGSTSLHGTRTLLTVHGRIIDHITTLIEPAYASLTPDQTLEDYLFLESTLKIWCAHATRCGEPLVDGELTHPLLKPWARALLSAMTASTPMGTFEGSYASLTPVSDVLLDEVFFMWQWETELLREDGPPLYHDEKPHWLSFFPRTHGSWAAGVRVLRQWVRVCAGRRIVFGRHSRGMGLVPAVAMGGDVVCILHGSPVPVVLRRLGRCYRVVGQCYWHGWMEGEQVDWGQDEGQEFRLI